MARTQSKIHPDAAQIKALRAEIKDLKAHIETQSNSRQFTECNLAQQIRDEQAKRSKLETELKAAISYRDSVKDALNREIQLRKDAEATILTLSRRLADLEERNYKRAILQNTPMAKLIQQGWVEPDTLTIPYEVEARDSADA